MEETEVGALFPTQGIDSTCEYMRQPDATTPDAENVRAFDQIEERARGGSRPGINKYVPEQVVLERYQVQHLNVLVDPQQPALSGNFETNDPSTTNGPYRVPGRKIRAKGNGRRPRKPDNASSVDIAFVAKYREQPGTLSAAHNFNVPGTPLIDDVIIVFVRTEVSGASPEHVGSLRNMEGIDLLKVGPSGNEYADNTYNIGLETTTSLSCWYKPYKNANDNTLTITPGSSGVYEIVVMLYRNANPDGPVSNSVKNATASSENPYVLPDLALDNTTGQLVVACFDKVNNSLLSVPTNYVERFGSVNSEVANVSVIERSGLSGVGPENPSVTMILSRPWVGFAVALTNQ